MLWRVINFDQNEAISDLFVSLHIYLTNQTQAFWRHSTSPIAAFNCCFFGFFLEVAGFLFD
jgi:hypothetical protein